MLASSSCFWAGSGLGAARFFARCSWTLFLGRGALRLPSRTSHKSYTAVIASMGTITCCCLIALSKTLATSLILSAGMSFGMAIAWCFILLVSDLRSAPVDTRIPFSVL